MSTIAQDEIYRVRVRGLRDICIGGPVTVKDADTGAVLKVINKPAVFEDIVFDARNLNHRTNLRKSTKHAGGAGL